MYTNIYQNLLAQFNKLFSHNRQGSYRTKHRYAEAFKRFLFFLAEMFRLEKLANIAPKHVYAYADKLVRSGKSVAYIKTELTAIRFWHDQIPNAKFKYLPDNQALNLVRRKYGGVNRSWSNREFNLAIAKAMELGHEDYAAVLCLARYAALRLHECFRIDTQTAEAALKTGKLTVKGKGGLVREVSINLSIEIELGKMLAVTPRGHKLFVKPDNKTHLAMHRFQNFIIRHKADIHDPGSTRPLHFHGLRHSTASILHDKGWDIRDIQDWLRHADFETTANIYTHISKQRKTKLAKDMENTFRLWRSVRKVLERPIFALAFVAKKQMKNPRKREV